MTRVAVLDDYQNVAESLADWSSLPDGTEVIFYSYHLTDEEALVERLGDFDVVVLMRERTPFPRSLIEKLPRLRLIVTAAMRNVAIDVDAASDRGVVVCGTEGSGGATLDLTWALILALVRHLPSEDAALRSGRWQTTIGHDLSGRTLGVLGLGRLGGRVAQVGNAFGMEVIAWSENLTPERAAEVGATRVDKGELFARADVLSIHTVLSSRTRGLVGEAELAAMKPTAYLVNTSRAHVIDEQALVDALARRAIAGAALDNFWREPLSTDHPLVAMDHVVLTPHIAGGAFDAQAAIDDVGGVVENVARVLTGKPLLDVVGDRS